VPLLDPLSPLPHPPSHLVQITRSEVVQVIRWNRLRVVEAAQDA
jgi:hypothetical protein